MSELVTEIKRNLQQLRDLQLPPESWAYAEQLAQRFEQALDDDSSLTSIAIELRDLVDDLDRMKGVSNPAIGDPRRQSAQPSTWDILTRAAARADRPAGKAPPSGRDKG